MTRGIRWWGLGVFGVLVVAIGLVWLLVVDGLVKAMIEDKGTAAVGAKVELDAADLTLFPTGLTLTRLQVTNPDEQESGDRMRHPANVRPRPNSAGFARSVCMAAKSLTSRS